RRVEAIDCFRMNIGQFRFRRVQLDVRETFLVATRVEELAVQGAKQPRFHLRRIAELMAASGPDVERLLRKVERFLLPSRQAECELIQNAIVTIHELVKVRMLRAIRFVTHTSRQRQFYSDSPWNWGRIRSVQ